MLQGTLLNSVISVVILILSVVIHELAHGYSSYYFGDKTAFYAGRLTLNPIKHMDLFGSFILPLAAILLGSPIIFGWAKPVPVDPRNMKGRWSELLVALAGPLSNFFLAIIFAVLFRFSLGNTFFQTILIQTVAVNCVLGFFNLLPVPPLDGFHVLDQILGTRGRVVINFLIRYQFIVIFIVIFSLARLVSVPSLAIASFLLGTPL